MRVIQVDLNKDFSDAINEAVTVLKYGGVIIYPTDTLYGFGANALNTLAVEKIFRIKERSRTRPLPIIVKNLMWVEELAFVSQRNGEILKKIWPGEVTAILPKKSIVPDTVTAGKKSVGIRIPNYPLVDKILSKFGYPLISTSANISGDEGTGDINKILEIFESRFPAPDLVIDVGILPKSDPSIVVDLTSDKPKILRVGPSKPEQLLKILEI